jgi:dihydroxyacetone kinase
VRIAVLDGELDDVAGFTSSDLRRIAHRLSAAAAIMRAELNAQDALIGDGDLGITVAEGWRAVAEVAPGFSDDVGQALLQTSKAFQHVSSSSFGTLVAIAFMAAAKATMGRSVIPHTEIPALLRDARDAMRARGKSEPGDKTFLDSIDAVIAAITGLSEPARIVAAADAAAETALKDFRLRPNKIGRARMFADRSSGLDDPGMLAVRRIIAALRSADEPIGPEGTIDEFRIERPGA